ncbi:MAG: DNA recombination protein RmuC, partial [Pelagibacteraceae bacterium]|nr:DNA recombination protein RmuC [Pelagibacteraceae bacterium]
MQDSLLYIASALIVLLIAVLAIDIYLLINRRKQKDGDKAIEEINTLKESINNSMYTMSTSFNSLSKDVTRDMTQALVKVDEKVGVFNRQVEDLNKSQASFSKILAGVKKYGTLAEFSL